MPGPVPACTGCGLTTYLPNRSVAPSVTTMRAADDIHDSQRILMRNSLVGLACLLFGAYAAYRSALDGAWIFVLGGAALAVAGVAYIVRPGPRSTGLVELIWGLMIVGHVIRSMTGLGADDTRPTRWVGGAMIGGVLIVAGIRHLLVHQPPAMERPTKTPQDDDSAQERSRAE